MDIKYANPKAVSLQNLKIFLGEIDNVYLRKDGIQSLSDEEIKLLFVRPSNEVSTATVLTEKIARGGQIDVIASFGLPANKTEKEDRIIFYKDTIVNLHDNFIYADAAADVETKNWCALYVEEGANVVFEANEGGIGHADGSYKLNQDGPYCITNFGGTITIKSGKYEGLGTCVYGYSGTTIIEGGYFDASPVANEGQLTRPWTLNLLNSAYEDGTAKMIVRGGTFVDFDPSNPNTDDAPTYVDEGYKVVSESVNGHTLYTVVKE